MTAPRRSKRDDGFVAAEFVAGLGFLLLPVALLVMVLPTWSERQSMAHVAAREAARTYVLTGDEAKARAMVEEIAQNASLASDQVSVELSGDPNDPGSNITASVTVGVPATRIPLFDADVDAFHLTESHTEVVDLYRGAVR